MLNKFVPEDFELKKEDKKDFHQSIIRRNNLSNEFTMVDVEHAVVELEKLNKEATSQIGLSGNMMKNIKDNNKFINNLSEEQIHAVWMYFENAQIVAVAGNKQKEIRKQLITYKKLKDMIYHKFGFVESNVLDKPKKLEEKYNR